LALLLIDYLEGRSLRASKPWLEKLPLFAISIVFGFVAVSAQRANGAMENLDKIPLHITLLGSSHGLWLYLVKAVVPFHLSTFHPYPRMEDGVAPWYFFASLLGLIALGAAVWRYFRSDRQLVFGLAFFLITIAPVIRLLPFGGAFIAERFTYVPYIGLFVAVGALIATAMQSTTLQRRVRSGVLVSVLTAYVLALGACTWMRTAAWQHGGTLWTDAIDHYPDHQLGYMNRGAYWASQGELDRAETDMLAGLRHAPDSAGLYRDVAFLYLLKGDHDQALQYSEAGLQLESDDPGLWLNLGISQQKLGNPSDALLSMSRAVELDPRGYRAHLNRGFLHQSAGRDSEAFEDYSAAIRIDPYNPAGHRYRGGFHINRQEWQEAVDDLSRAIRISPGYGETHAWRSRAYRALARYEAALTDARRAGELGAPMGEAHEAWLRERIER
jgi:tetratricopeptide (TPR) repeat protein